VTKSAIDDVMMMRLARKYGASFIDERIAKYLPAARTAGWRDVTFSDLATMASGHGPAGDPTCYLCDYSRWYLAGPAWRKTAEALDYPRYTEPGTQYNYRDQDAYLLMAAGTAFLKAKEGAGASVARMLRREVFDRIGIHTLSSNRTVERRGAGMLVGAFGYYPTVDDLAKISRLFQNDGRWHGHQVLNAKLVKRLYPSPGEVPAQALPENDEGSVYYLYNWHLPPVSGAAGCTRYVPQMEGWGGNTVTSFPGREHVTLIRLRNDWDGDTTDPQRAINALGTALSPICR
jgi:CubicO group peptidase (beta-lactamase class C family)